MFETIYFEKEEKCEECGYKDVLFNAIIDGQQKRICNRCVIANGAIVLKKSADVKIEEVPRRSVREIMEELSGVKPRPLEKPARMVKLEDLRKRYEEVKERRKLLHEAQERERQMLTAKKEAEEKGNAEKVLDEKEFIKYLEKEKSAEQLPQQQAQLQQATQETGRDKKIDFSIEATKRTRIRDLLEKMQELNRED
ncbi:MAG: DUF1682 domain-containing protein [Candidatus Pacearchaeota archaeon]|nr:DUF1682 domain-containing protein [Candidatus Pacearchaeota archaeon]